MFKKLVIVLVLAFAMKCFGSTAIVTTGGENADILTGDSNGIVYRDPNGSYRIADVNDMGAASIPDACEAAWNTKQGKSFLLVAASDAPAATILSADYICDGNADNVQIQAALYAAEANKMTVVLSQGKFIPNTSLTCPDYVPIRGMGIFSTEIEPSVSLTGAVFARTGTTETALAYRTSATAPSHGITISDLEIDGTNMARSGVGTYSATGGKGITMAYLIDCSFERIYCHDTPASGFGTDQHRNVVYRDCIAEDCGQIDARYESDPTQSRGCHGFGLGTGGDFAGGNENLRIESCVAFDNNNSEGFVLEKTDGNGDTRNVMLVDCISYHNKTGFAVDGNPTYTTYEGSGGIRNVVFQGCKAYNNTASGLKLNMAVQYCTVANCDFYRNGLYGIYIYAPGASGLSGGEPFHNTITGCKIYGNTMDGIRMYSGNILVSNNQIFSNVLCGVYVQTSNCDIRNLSFVGNQVYNNSAGAVTKDGIEFLTTSGAAYDMYNLSLVGNACYDYVGQTYSGAIENVNEMAEGRDYNRDGDQTDPNINRLTTIRMTPWVHGETITIGSGGSWDGVYTVQENEGRIVILSTAVDTNAFAADTSVTAVRIASQRNGISFYAFSGALISNVRLCGNMLFGNITTNLKIAATYVTDILDCNTTEADPIYVAGIANYQTQALTDANYSTKYDSNNFDRKITITADRTILASESGFTFNNYGATKDINVIIPAATSSMISYKYKFQDVNGTFGLIFNVAATDTAKVRGAVVKNPSIGEDVITGAGKANVVLIYEDPNNLLFGVGYGDDVNEAVP